MGRNKNFYFFFPYYSYFISFLSIIFRIHINISPLKNSSTKISEHNKTRGEYLILIWYKHNDIPTRLIIYHICKIYNILIKKKKKENNKKEKRPPTKRPAGSWARWRTPDDAVLWLSGGPWGPTFLLVSKSFAILYK